MALITTISVWLIPMIIGIVFIAGMLKRVPTYETFVEGGKEGFQMAVSIMPYLVGMLVSIGVFRASGAMEAMVDFMKPFFSSIGVPSEVVPLAIIRPISGNGALGMMSNILQHYGPDSFIGRLAATIQGTTDTTFYIVTVYFGAVGIRKIGDSLKVGLLADLVGFAAAIIIVSIVFGK